MKELTITISIRHFVDSKAFHNFRPMKRQDGKPGFGMLIPRHFIEVEWKRE